ncbi:SDR family oxidoreductase [Actinoalloteichus hymeniacidonis]|uniref:Short-chain alcohol dehydrogenase n=1 Tax=Actinoalloteichus hymeniacidonis TaxID=340345 RepID=A0AAC9HM69_9PSEU|nr:SDR family oxidoreductase [Actinoalloteichus hymeniacidonis]AOS61882.1 short-chain alcohol dehydrogenase [Actinoalloteichus hymeniacidonis]MBB5910098.1 NADP-dependent 3-hydroxy acid dehydrogenase YdfG [Actinoalloteichus hymeniacidonis]
MTTDNEQPRVILVTGASSGIGEATARHLAAEGHHVVLTARRTDRLDAIVADIEQAGHSAEARALDVTDRTAFQALVEDVVTTRGRLDVLVGNAGVMLLSRLDVLLVEEWDRMFEVNVRGLYNGIAAVLPHFQRQRSGHVITMASTGAHEVPPTSAIYSATKYAAWALTEGLRIESDPAIRVTTISPGVTQSELADHITDAHAAGFMVDYRRSAIPADAIARAVGFAIAQPADIDVSEIIVRPTAQR